VGRSVQRGRRVPRRHRLLSDLLLSWGDSCNLGGTDYAIYEGTLGDLASALPRACSTSGLPWGSISTPPGDRFFLVVPRSESFEGSYGEGSDGLERPPSAAACAPQLLGGCGETSP
jgi:hypothetical protein